MSTFKIQGRLLTEDGDSHLAASSVEGCDAPCSEPVPVFVMPTEQCPIAIQDESPSDIFRAATMSIRVTKTTAAGETVLRIDGRLRGEDIDEMKREVGLVEGPLVLELVDLQSADAEGIELLRRTAAAGATLQGARLHISNSY